MIKKEFKINRQKGFKDWDQFKNDLHEYLIDRGYCFFKEKQLCKLEDFSYRKTIKDKYQICILVYDFTKYVLGDRISISFNCSILNIESRIELSVSSNIEVPEFEIMAEQFYETFIKLKSR